MLVDATPRSDRGLERVVPDGRMELIVHLGEPFTRLGAVPPGERQPRAVLAGQLLGPLLLRPGSTIDVFAIGFEPWGARAILGVRPRDVVERLPALDEFVGPDADRLGDQLARAATPRARVEAAERWCALRLGRMRPPPRGLVQAARAARWGAGPGSAQNSVHALAAHVGWGTRRLERAFLEHVGLAPKPFLRVARLQRALHALEACPPCPLALLALQQGYADQAHFTREFTRLVGASPARYRAEQHELQAALLDPLDAPGSEPTSGSGGTWGGEAEPRSRR